MPMTPDGERISCKSCAFMDASNSRPFCRRYPAQLVTDGANVKALYPVVDPATDWCGEHSEFGPPKILKSTEH